MAILNLNVPEANLTSPSSWGSRKAVSDQVGSIVSKYGNYIKWASKESNIPMEVIASFIAVESGGSPTAGGSGSVTQGLMQWNRNFAKSTLEGEKKLGRLSANEEAKLKTYGITFDKSGLTRSITQADQIKPELNIIIGSILLGQYIDSIHDATKFTKDSSGKTIYWGVDKNNTMRLDKIIAVYNSGAYGDTGKKARLGNYATPLALANDVNSTTSAYIKKMLGVNGGMDVATKENKDKFDALR
jgi:hypothetical protein